MASPVSSLTASRSPSLEPSPEPLAQPDHFYGADPSHLPSPHSEVKTYLSPDDDPLANRGIPVFKPTMREFADFEHYMTRVEAWGRRAGIVKVIPPKEWTDALPDIKPQLANVKIKSPIEQFMRGRGGLFRQENMEKRKEMSVREWAELCAKDDFRAPSVEQVGLHNNPSARAPLPSRKKKKPAVPIREEEEEDAQVPGSIASPPNSASPDPEDAIPSTSASNNKARNRRIERADKDATFMETFNPHLDWHPQGTSAEDYTPEFCYKLERAFWRNCGIGKPAWYGADTMGSLFTDDTRSWNVAHLPSTLSRLLPSAQGLPGVNTPYLYFGMWRATFAWHVEDMDLFSINYIHFGAPKFWYAVPQARANALESTMRGYFPKDTSHCPQFLRHKSFLASPTLLAQSAVRANHLVQHAGEFVITYPRGYHAGFNLGLNCAESVNFALDSWLDEGRKAGACACVDFSVRIDVDQLLADRAAEREAGLVAAPATEPTQPAKPRSDRKRKAPIPFDPEGPPVKRAKPAKTHKSAVEKVTLKLGLASGATFEEDTFPCCLCVDHGTEDLVRVHDLPMAWRELGSAARIHFPDSTGGLGVWMAHESCAMVLPDTWVDDVNGERFVFGVDGIVRGRWTLKCSVCTRHRAKSHGALIQCTKGKCSKAFHINCARDDPRVAYTVVNEVEKEVVLLEPTCADSDMHVLKTIKKIEVETMCPQHNPAVIDERRASKQRNLRDDVLALPPLARIKLRMSSGMFEVTLLKVLEEKKSIQVSWNLGGVREFKWSAIVFGPGTVDNSNAVAGPSSVTPTPTTITSSSAIASARVAPSENPRPSSTTAAPRDNFKHWIHPNIETPSVFAATTETVPAPSPGAGRGHYPSRCYTQPSAQQSWTYYQVPPGSQPPKNPPLDPSLR
ncbi:unnamed protein product [Mycena citricolor]|uniref:[histone H3]-trimethyl-L-lysine(9) demethylase n=1 Tax=Mycena citricolor TaxID=2018698 RepID=A0AAD2GVY3_9AGAR|nr:unnamed protein product [Mycena citricolor]